MPKLVRAVSRDPVLEIASVPYQLMQRATGYPPVPSAGGVNLFIFVNEMEQGPGPGLYSKIKKRIS